MGSIITLFIIFQSILYAKSLSVRKILLTVPVAVTFNLLSLPLNPTNNIAHAVINDPDAIIRYESAQQELKDLDKNWDTISNKGGDNIRRRLGTVYSPPKCESPLCSFNIFTEKFVKNHVDDLDLSEFDSPSGELLQALNQADFLAYSSVFSDYGNGGGESGADYIDKSHFQVKRAIEAITEVIGVLKQ